MKIFVRKNNSTVGPYGKDEFISLLKKGSFSQNDLICMNGQNWVNVKNSGLVQSGIVRKLWFKVLVAVTFSSILLTLAFYFADQVGFGGNFEDSEQRDLGYFDLKVNKNDSFKIGATIVLSIAGSVMSADSEEKKIIEAKEGQVLLPGSRILTGDDGEAVVLFSNGSCVAVGRKTNFSVSLFEQREFNASVDLVESTLKETSSSHINIDLDMGELVVVVKKLERDSSLILSSNLAFAGVRGTSFSMNVKKDFSMVNVLSGEVDFLDRSKRSKLVRANERAWSDGLKLVLEPEILPVDRERIEALETKAIRAIKDIPINRLREYFDMVNPNLGVCEPGKKKEQFLAAGGKPEVTNSINRGLDWLISIQQDDGSWGAGDMDSSGENIRVDLWQKRSMTGLAVLCLLGNCELDPNTIRGQAVVRGIKFLKSNLSNQGIGGGNRGSYSHPMQTRALVLASYRLKDPELQRASFEAIAVIINGQNENGGWAYGYGKGSSAHVDLSVTGWNIMALAEAQSAGLGVSGLDGAMDRAMEYVKKTQHQTGKFAYQIGKVGKPSLTGMGVHCLQLGGEGNSVEAKKGLDWLFENLPTSWGNIDFYGIRHAGMACIGAMYILSESKYWASFREKIPEILIENQKPEGFWPHAAHFHGDSKLFRTILGIEILSTFSTREINRYQKVR